MKNKKWLENSFLYKLFFTEIWQLLILPTKLITNPVCNRQKNIIVHQHQGKKAIASNKSYSFYADPFGIYINNHYYIYFEYLNYRNKKGEIHYNKYDKDFNLIESKLALTKPYHLSYPYIFQDDQQIALLPEMTGAKGKQNIFIASNLPEKWQEYQLNIPTLIDPSIFKYKNSYIILGSNSKKVAFISDKLLGPYKEIKYISNHSYHQSGGKIYQNNGEFYRPLQVSLKTYGEKIFITKLNIGKDYIEEAKEAGSFISCNEQKGLHTLSLINNDFTVIDTKYFHFSLFKFIISIQKSFNKKRRKISLK